MSSNPADPASRRMGAVHEPSSSTFANERRCRRLLEPRQRVCSGACPRMAVPLRPSLIFRLPCPRNCASGGSTFLRFGASGGQKSGAVGGLESGGGGVAELERGGGEVAGFDVRRYGVVRARSRSSATLDGGSSRRFPVMRSRPANVGLIHRRCRRPSAAQDREATQHPEPDPLDLLLQVKGLMSEA